MKIITFELSQLHLHGSAFFDYLGLRKRFFVDTLGWEIPHNNDVEMDQYDNPLAHYSLVLRNGEVIGGARAMPTTSSWGGVYLHAARCGCGETAGHSRPGDGHRDRGCKSLGVYAVGDFG